MINDFMVQLQAKLDEVKSKKQIDSDIKELEKVVKNLRLTATLAKGTSKQQIEQTIKQLEGQFRHIKLQAKFDQKNIKADIDKALQNVSFKDIDLNIDSGKTKLKIQKVIADAKRTVQSNPISLNLDLKRDKLNNQLTAYVSRNSKIRESEGLLKQVDSLRNKISGINDSDSLKRATQEFQLFKSEVSATGYATKSTSDKIRGLIGGVTKIGSTLGVASLAVSNFSKSLKTICQNDTILTEISKTSDSTKQELEQLGNSAFDTASKFGQLSSDYLTAVQEMNRSGFYGEAGKALGELTLKTQAAGDVSAETAQKYLLATNAAYGYSGNVKKLTAVLDGQNYITNKHSVDMEVMATATEKAGSMAANTGVKINELSAMIGTISARTKEAGTITGTGIKSLLVNLQNLSSDKIVGTLKRANASMTETVNGIEKLRSPIDILKDLAKTYNSLDDSDPLKSEITTNIGQKYHANQLSSLLAGWSDYEKMLKDYSEGMDSAEVEAQKTAESLEGRFNALQNSWDELVNSLTSKDALKGGIGFFDGLLQSASKLVDTFDVLPVALASVTGFMTAKNKDYGISQIFNEDGKFDVQGSIFGIDISQMKHFSEAEKAIARWNQKLVNGVTDINSFNNETVKNTAQLKDYLKTCSKDAPASLNGYKKHLQAAGVETNSLRLGTILLNSALSFGLGLAIQGVITGIDKLSNHIGDTEDKAQSLSNSMSESISSISENSKTVKELNERYQELSKGVDIAGNNVSLTSSDYDEYKKVVSQLSDIMPNLTTMFNAQGEKIGFVGGKLKDANEQYKEYIRNTANKFLTDGNEDGKSVDDIVDDWNNKNTKLGFNYIDEVKAALGGYSKGDIEEIYSSQELLSEYQKLYDMSQEELYSYFDKADRKQSGIGYALKRFLKIDLDQLKEDGHYVNTLKGDLNSYITEYKTSVESSAKEIQQVAQYMFLNNENLYNGNLSEDASSYISNIISNLSNDFIKSNFTDKDGKLLKSRIQSYVDALVESFMGKDGIKIGGLFSKLFTLDTSDLSIEEIRKQVDEYINQLYSLMKQDGESIKDFKLRIGISEDTYIDEDTKTLVNNAKSKLEEKYRDNVEKELSTEELEIVAEKVKVPEGTLLSWDELKAKIEAVKNSVNTTNHTTPQTFSKVWKSIGTTGDDDAKKAAKEEKEKFLELAKAGKLTQEKLKKSSIADEFDKASISIDEATKRINKFAEAADQLASMSKGMSSITGALDEKQTNLSDKKTHTKGVKAETLAGFDAEIKGLDSWDEFERTLGNGKKSMEQCRKAANKLATEWMGSNNFLANLTETEKDYYISALNNMGVDNAEAIVTETLAIKRQEQAQADADAEAQAGALAVTKNGVTAETLAEVDALIQEKGASDEVKYSIVDAIAKENIFSNNSLSVDQKVEALRKLIGTYYDAATATEFLNRVQNGEDYQKAFDSSTNSKLVSGIDGSLATQPIVKVKKPSQNSNKKKGTKKQKEKKQKESKQEFDWMERKVTVLNNKLSETEKRYEAIAAAMKKIDSSAMVRKENANLNKQIRMLRKLRATYGKQEKNYQSKANKYAKANLSKDLQNKVKNGKIKGSYSKLVKQYGEKKANKIQKAIDLYDKASTARQNKVDTSTQIKDAKIQKHQNRADLAQSKIDKNAARAELVHLSKKNKYIDNEIKQTEKLYSHQIDIARLNRDNEEVARLQAERDKEIRDLEVEKLQNIADEGEESYTLYKTQASMTTNYKDRNKLAKNVTDSLRKQYSNLIKIAEKEGDIVEKNRLQLELQQKLNEESKERIQNVSEDYGNRLIENSRQIQVWNNAASLAEAKGKTVNADFYNQMASVAGQEEEKRKKEVDDVWQTYYEQMRDNPDFINSQEWYDSIQIINDATDAYEQAQISAEQYRQKAIEADWSIADTARQAIDYLNDEAEAYKNIFGYEDMYDKNGVLTDAGTATFALDVYGIKNNIDKIEKYNSEIDELNKQYKDDDISIEKYNERMQELKDGVMDSTEAIYSLRDAMKSLIEEGLNAEMDALNESIDKVKQNLSDASSLREYQKNIEKQTKNIASLERQINAKSGDMSEKGRSDLQKLKVQLEDARSELEDTEYEKYIEDQERILDDMSDDFQKYLDAQLDQVDRLLQGIIDSIGDGKVPVSEIIKQVGDTIGVDLSRVLSENLLMFANTGNTNAGGVYDNTIKDYKDSAKEEFDKGGNTPIMNTDEKKGTVESNAKASDPAYQKTSAWLKSKGFSDKDIDTMYGSMNNAQKVFSGIQNAGGNPDAMQIFGEYQKNKVKGEGFSLYSQTDIYKEAKRKEEEHQQNMKDRKNNNDVKQKEIARLFATVRKYEEAEEYATGTLFSYGAQKFAVDNGKGDKKFLSMDNVKKIDSLVKELVDVQTGKPVFDTSSGTKVYDAIKMLDEANAHAFSNAIKNRKVSSFNPAGFSKGGIVDTSTLAKVAKDNGDDAWVTVKSGEGILNPMDTKNILALTESLERFKHAGIQPLDSSNMVTNNVNASSNMYGDVSIHLDGSNIKDVDTFVNWNINAIQHSKRLRNAYGLVGVSQLTNDTMAFKRM